MKKFLIKALAVATLTGCLAIGENLDPEAAAILTSTAKEIGDRKVSKAQSSVLSKCMAKYHDADTCSCVTSSVVNSIGSSNISEGSLSQRIAAAQINCMAQKLAQ